MDTAEQFVRLIEAQRGYQASSRVISIEDEILAFMSYPESGALAAATSISGIVSDGSTKPYRVKARGPSFSNISVLDALTARGGCMVADMVAIIGSFDIVMGEVDR